MKRKLLLILTSLLPMLASAYNAEIDGIYYNFSGDNATVTYQAYDTFGYYISNYSGSVVIPESVTYNGKTYSVTSIGDWAFRQCTSLTSITIPESVTSIGNQAFYVCKLRNVLVKCITPPILDNDEDEDRSKTFSQATCHHATLYVPAGTWDDYAFANGWLWFNNIRETALEEGQVSAQQAYTLMDAGTFVYSVYDPVNDCIGTINSAGNINEDNPNHSWQMIEAGGMHFLYNIGAKKYVRRNGNTYEMTETPEPIDLADGDNSLILGQQTDKQWALVSNERLNVAQSAIDEVTGISNLNAADKNSTIYNLAGQRISKMQKGINIRNGKKLLVK